MPANVRGMMADPEFKALPDDRKRALLLKAGAPEGFISEYLGKQPSLDTSRGMSISSAPAGSSFEMPSPSEAFDRIMGLADMKGSRSTAVPVSEQPLGDKDAAAIVKGLVQTVAIGTAPHMVGVSLPVLAAVAGATHAVTPALAKAGRAGGAAVGMPETGEVLGEQLPLLAPVAAGKAMGAVGNWRAARAAARAAAPVVEAAVPAVEATAPAAEAGPSTMSRVVEAAKPLKGEAGKIALELLGRRVLGLTGIPGAPLMGGRLGRFMGKLLMGEASALRGGEKALAEAASNAALPEGVTEDAIASAMKQIPGTSRDKAIELLTRAPASRAPRTPPAPISDEARASIDAAVERGKQATGAVMPSAAPGPAPASTPDSTEALRSEIIGKIKTLTTEHKLSRGQAADAISQLYGLDKGTARRAVEAALGPGNNKVAAAVAKMRGQAPPTTEVAPATEPVPGPAAAPSPTGAPVPKSPSTPSTAAVTKPYKSADEIPEGVMGNLERAYQGDGHAAAVEMGVAMGIPEETAIQAANKIEAAAFEAELQASRAAAASPSPAAAPAPARTAPAAPAVAEKAGAAPAAAPATPAEPPAAEGVSRGRRGFLGRMIKGAAGAAVAAAAPETVTAAVTGAEAPPATGVVAKAAKSLAPAFKRLFHNRTIRNAYESDPNTDTNYFEGKELVKAILTAVKNGSNVVRDPWSTDGVTMEQAMGYLRDYTRSTPSASGALPEFLPIYKALKKDPAAAAAQWDAYKAARAAAKAARVASKTGEAPSSIPDTKVDAEVASAPPGPAPAPTAGDLAGKVPPVTTHPTVDKLPAVTEGHVRVYHGQEGSSGSSGGAWTTDPARARSYGGDVSYVDVPKKVFDAGNAKGRAQGEQFGPMDTWLEGEHIKGAKPVHVPEQVHTAEAASASERDALFKELGVEEIKPPTKAPEKAPAPSDDEEIDLSSLAPSPSPTRPAVGTKVTFSPEFAKAHHLKDGTVGTISGHESGGDGVYVSLGKHEMLHVDTGNLGALTAKPVTAAPNNKFDAAWRKAAFAREKGPTDAEWAKMGGARAKRAWLESKGKVAEGPSTRDKQFEVGHVSEPAPSTKKTLRQTVDELARTKKEYRKAGPPLIGDGEDLAALDKGKPASEISIKIGHEDEVLKALKEHGILFELKPMSPGQTGYRSVRVSKTEEGLKALKDAVDLPHSTPKEIEDRHRAVGRAFGYKEEDIQAFIDKVGDPKAMARHHGKGTVSIEEIRAREAAQAAQEPAPTPNWPSMSDKTTGPPPAPTTPAPLPPPAKPGKTVTLKQWQVELLNEAYDLGLDPKTPVKVKVVDHNTDKYGIREYSVSVEGDSTDPLSIPDHWIDTPSRPNKVKIAATKVARQKVEARISPNPKGIMTAAVHPGKHKVGDVLPNGSVVKQVDEAGNILVTTKPKPTPPRGKSYGDK